MLSSLKKNGLSLWKSNQFLICLFLVTLSLDMLSTIRFMRNTGPQDELHPAVRFVSVVFGPVAGPVLSALCKAAATAIVLLALKKHARKILLVATVCYLFAFFYNTFAVDLYLSGRLPCLPF